MILRILLKASVPLVIVLGGMSYFASLQGRDPVAFLLAPLRHSTQVPWISSQNDASQRALPAMPGAGGSMPPWQALANMPAAVAPKPALPAGPVPLHTVGSETRVYRWRDAQGGLHFSDAPPQEQAAEVVRFDPDANLVPGFRDP